MQGIVRELAGQPHDLVRRRSSGSASCPWLPGLSGRTGRGGVRLGYRRGCCKPQSRILAVRTPRARAREADKANPTPRRRSVSAGSPAQPLRHGHSQAREGDGWTGTSRALCGGRVRESLVRAGVRANLFAGVTPSEGRHRRCGGGARGRGGAFAPAHFARPPRAALRSSAWWAPRRRAPTRGALLKVTELSRVHRGFVPVPPEARAPRSAASRRDSRPAPRLEGGLTFARGFARTCSPG